MSWCRFAKILALTLFGALVGYFVARALGAIGHVADGVVIAPPALIGMGTGFLAFDRSGGFRNQNWVIAALLLIMTLVSALILVGFLIISSSTDL